jgi:hypothetical protein
MDNLNNKLSDEAQTQASCLGVVSGWQFCKDILPEEKHTKKGYWENEDLLLIKWDKRDSLELAVLTRLNGVLIWEIPDHGNAEISEVSQWMHIPACR